VAVLCFCFAASAQTDQTAERIEAIEVTGNEQIPDEAVLGYVKTRTGEIYDEQRIERDVQALLESGRFKSARASVSRSATGVTVTFHVTERPLVSALAFEGNKSIKDSELAAVLSFGTYSPLDRFDIRTGRETILAKYRSEGFHFAEVTLDEQALTERNEVIYRIVEGPRVYLRKVDFRGNEHFSDFKLALKTDSSAGVWLFSLPVVPGKLDTDKVQQDIQTIRGMYRAEGFLEAEVDRILEFSDDKRRVTLNFVIDEGPRYVVSDVTFKGNSIFTDEELTRRISLGVGGFYTSLGMKRDVQKLKDGYGELGFVDTQVNGNYVYKTERGQVDLVFTIDEGVQQRVGQITIRGNEETQSRVIRREMRVFPDQLYNTVAVDESRRRLLETNLFEDVEIRRIPRGPDVSDIVVDVEERQTSRLAIGAGLSTRDGLIGTVDFTQQNFDIFGWPKSWKEFIHGKSFKGAGQTLRIVAEPGTEIMRFRVEWFEPYLMDQPYSLGLSSFLFTRQRSTYDETRVGGIVSVGHRFKNRWYGELATRIEGIQIDSLDTDAPPEVIADRGSHAVVGLKGSLTKDRTDSRWLPSEGDRFRLSYEQVVGDFNFGRANGDYRRYWTVYVDSLDRKHIIAARLSVGQIFGDAPVFERFYGGGIGSIRGFEYRGISPRSKGTNKVIGGETMFFAGAEYTFPIIGTPREGQIRGVLFLDTGTVEEDFSLTTYRASIGAGIRWTVPFFGPIPISLDFGFPLSKGDEDDEQVFSFSLGWTF